MAPDLEQETVLGHCLDEERVPVWGQVPETAEHPRVRAARQRWRRGGCSVPACHLPCAGCLARHGMRI